MEKFQIPEGVKPSYVFLSVQSGNKQSKPQKVEKEA